VTALPVPLRLSGGDAVHAELLDSACTHQHLAMPSRCDPYWDRLWAPGSQALWTDGDMSRHHRREGLARVNNRLVMDEHEARRLLTSNCGRTDPQCLWGVVDSRRTVSAEQAAAFTGSHLLLDPNHSQVSASSATNVINMGSFANPLRIAPGLGRSSVYRPNGPDVFPPPIKQTLPWPTRSRSPVATRGTEAVNTTGTTSSPPSSPYVTAKSSRSSRWPRSGRRRALGSRHQFHDRNGRQCQSCVPYDYFHLPHRETSMTNSFIRSSSTPSSEDVAFVQPIVLLIDKTDPAPEADGILAAALASVSAYASDLLNSCGDTTSWEAWLDGRFTKSVRRADVKAYSKVVNELHGEATEAVVGRARALAFRPAPYEQYPQVLSRLQVSGTHLPQASGTHRASYEKAPTPVIVLNADLGMTTGKAAAQASHALFAWFLTLDEDTQRAWAGKLTGDVLFLDADDFRDFVVKAVPGSVIVDAGLTEIAPSSTTAYVMVPTGPL
jgi:peptidyl-tRNA hydrolase